MNKSDSETDEKQVTSFDNGEIIIFPGFQDNMPTVVEGVEIKEELDTGRTPEVSGTDRERVKNNILSRLEGCHAEEVQDIDLERNRYMEFRIKLIDPNQRPIRCKARPIPQSLKDMVKKAIFDQLEAGLIRHSTSEWASPLHIQQTRRFSTYYCRLSLTQQGD